MIVKIKNFEFRNVVTSSCRHVYVYFTVLLVFFVFLSGCLGPLYSYTIHKTFEGLKEYTFRADDDFGEKIRNIGVIPFVSSPLTERIYSEGIHHTILREFGLHVKGFRFYPLKTVNGYSAKESSEYLKKNGMKKFLEWTGCKRQIDAICYGTLTEQDKSFAPARGIAVEDLINIYIVDTNGKIVFEASQTRYDISDVIMVEAAELFGKTLNSLSKPKI